MLRHFVLSSTCLLAALLTVVQSAKQQVQLSDSYLPVAMQVIAHLTDQMAYEVRDEPTSQPTKPTTKPSTKPTNSWTKPSTNSGTKPTSSWTKPPTNSGTKPTNAWTKPPTNTWTKPTNTWSKPTDSWSSSKPVTSKPYVSSDYVGFWSAPGWSFSYGLLPRSLLTTPYHRPGLFAPIAPPKPSERNKIMPKTDFILLPIDHNTQYTVIEPEKTKTDEPFLSIHEEEVKPLIEPAKDTDHLLPPHFEAEVDKISRAEDESDENLQYLSENVRDLIRMAKDPADERVVDVWEGVRASNREDGPKGKLSSSNLRLLLLYDLLSREAKRLRLSDYSGFSPDVMKDLVESSGGGARAQLSLALGRMVSRRDCEHEYANNRAKEMVQELAKDDSKLSAELRYLQPLVYAF